MMQFRDMELDFDLLDADHAEAYEAALEGLRDVAQKPPAGSTLSVVIRYECSKVFSFFDALFGEGFHTQVFGERTNLKECLDTLEEFIRLASKQREELNDRIAKLQAEAAGSTPKKSGQASRRAAGRAPTAAVKK